MKIIHLLWTLATGGVETMLVDIVNEQVESDKVTIIVINDCYNQTLIDQLDKRCDIVLLRRKVGSRNIIPWLRLNMIISRIKPDIIHFHLEGMRKMVFNHVPKVFTIHNIHTSGAEYSKYDALYAISESVRLFTEKQGYQSITVRNGIHPEQLKKRDLNQGITGKLNIVCVGRLYSPHKGQDILINALSVLKRKGVDGIHLDLIGDGESRKELENMVIECGLESMVSFLGHRNRDYVFNHLCDYDLFVLPSRSEGFGLSVAEAMAAMVPVLVSDISGPMEIIDNGRVGMYFKSEDYYDLANKIEKTLMNGYEMRMVNEAFDFVAENFNIKNTAKKYLEEYKNVINRL